MAEGMARKGWVYTLQEVKAFELIWRRDWQRGVCGESLLLLAWRAGWMVFPFTKTETHEDKGQEYGLDMLGLTEEAKGGLLTVRAQAQRRGLGGRGSREVPVTCGRVLMEPLDTEEPASEKVGSGEGMCPSRLEGAPQPRAIYIRSKSGPQGMGEDRRPCSRHTVQQRSCRRSTRGLSCRWDDSVCVSCGGWGRGAHRTPTSGDTRGEA